MNSEIERIKKAKHKTEQKLIGLIERELDQLAEDTRLSAGDVRVGIVTHMKSSGGYVSKVSSVDIDLIF